MGQVAMNSLARTTGTDSLLSGRIGATSHPGKKMTKNKKYSQPAGDSSSDKNKMANRQHLVTPKPTAGLGAAFAVLRISSPSNPSTNPH
jgi:hypothetical protein